MVRLTGDFQSHFRLKKNALPVFGRQIQHVGNGLDIGQLHLGAAGAFHVESLPADAQSVEDVLHGLALAKKLCLDAVIHRQIITPSLTLVLVWMLQVSGVAPLRCSLTCIYLPGYLPAPARARINTFWLFLQSGI